MTFQFNLVMCTIKLVIQSTNLTLSGNLLKIEVYDYVVD